MTDSSWSSVVRLHQVPPLPPDLGSLVQPTGQPFSYYVQPLSSISEGSGDGSGTAAQRAAQGGWRPKEGVLVGTLTEHTRAVNRLAVSQVRGLTETKTYGLCVQHPCGLLTSMIGS